MRVEWRTHTLTARGKQAFDNARTCWAGLVGVISPALGPEVRLWWINYWWDQCETALAESRHAEEVRGAKPR
jgi:hypothetical protein